ncbi:MAG: PilT/PilU family type 4a pilus ATPase [Clostridiales Family XIII bacterium]|jgi:twitching motility protein PilT|nr:PilT/PilU family type 4a pilus ATPase [Clostridiales Family XIII bacterium]
MESTITEVLEKAVALNASDVLLVPGLPVAYKINGNIKRFEAEKLQPSEIFRLIKGMYDVLPSRDIDGVASGRDGDDDFSFALPGLARFRVNVFKQRGSLAAVIRVVDFLLPDRNALGIPDNVMAMAEFTRGMVLVTGPAGSGKSTTLACLIDAINSSRNAHIITIEDPIEYLHHHKMGVVTQREIQTDTESYASALRSVLRQAPDVILLGEMRDSEAIKAAVTAAETGHLVISTLHTTGAVNTVDRIIDSFPAEQQQQIRIQISMVLQGIVSQQLVAAVDGLPVPAFEVVVCNNAVRNMIREANGHQMESLIYSSSAEGMITMDTSLLNLARQGKIAADTAVQAAMDKEKMRKRLNSDGGAI